MPTKIKTWEIKEGQDIKEIDTSMADEEVKEKKLQEWIEQRPEIVHKDLEILGSGVSIGGKEIDVLGFLPDGSLVVVELKRERSPRETIAQAIDYASRIADLDIARLSDSLGSEIEENLEEILNRKDMKRSDLKEKPRIMIVAPEIDDATKSMIDYLSEMYEVPINGVVFTYSKLFNGSEIISRTAVVSEEEMEERVSLTSRELENIAEHENIAEIIETLRGATNFLKKEEPFEASTWGKTFRYWKDDDGESKLAFGIKVEKSGRGSIKIWARQKNIANMEGSNAEKVVEELKEDFRVSHVTSTRIDIDIKNKPEAEKFVNWLKHKVAS